ncbi:MAG TPA: AsmA-like C-terminal domain-containing protein, partial [Thermodesulfobacteriota bacterium]
EEEEKEEEKEEEAKKEARKEAAKINGTGRIRAVEGDLWGHGFKSLETGAILGNRVIQLYPLHVNVDGGAANGSFSYFLDDAEPLLFTADLKFTGVDIQAMLAAFGNKKRVLSGDLRADVLLSATRGVKPAAHGMNGYVNISTGKGRLWKFGFLSDIFSIVNIISIDELFESGLQHKGIDGHFNMVDGVLSTEDLVMDSDTLRMSAVGEIDTAASTIYATLALHPFVTIDKIISNIPLAGWIITGEKESAVSLYFEMEGPLKDPDVMPLPVESMTENIFGILERLIRAPLKIFE